MSKSSTPPDDLERLARLADALADINGQDTAAGVATIDVKAWALDVERRVAAQAKHDKKAFHDGLGERARAGAARLAARRPEPIRPRIEQLAILSGLLDKLGPRAVSVHFHKHEETSDEDLARIIGELRALEEDAVGDPEE